MFDAHDLRDIVLEEAESDYDKEDVIKLPILMSKYIVPITPTPDEGMMLPTTRSYELCHQST